MLDLRLRAAKDLTLRPLTRLLSAHVSANTLTALSLTLALASAATAWTGAPALAVGCWLTSRLLDGLDGPVARARGEASDYGGYLDMTADTIGYALIPLGVALGVDQHDTSLAAAALLAVLFVNAISLSYLAALLEKRDLGARRRGEHTSVTMPPALIEGTETVAIYTLFLALPTHATSMFVGMAALVSVNVAQRLASARAMLAVHCFGTDHDRVGSGT